MKAFSHFLKLAWKTAPGYMLVLVFDSLLQGVKTILNVYLPKLLIDELIGERDVQRLMLYGGLIVANIVVMQFIANLLKKYVNVKRQKVAMYMRRAMSKKIMNIEYSYLEDPYYLDLKERAVFAINNQGAIEYSIKNFADVISGIATLIGLMAVMLTLGPVLLIALLAAFALMLAFYGLIAKSMFWFRQNIIPINRKYGYYFNLTMDNPSLRHGAHDH